MTAHAPVHKLPPFNPIGTALRPPPSLPPAEAVPKARAEYLAARESGNADLIERFSRRLTEAEDRLREATP